MSFGIPVRNGLAVGLLASTALSSRSGRNSVASLILNFMDGIYRALGMNYNFSDLITFTRSTTATFVGSNGLIQTAAINAPRFDYDPVTLAAKGLLIEEQRINLLTYSSQFDDVAWTKTRASITANVIASPDGTLNADKLVEDTSVTTSHFTNRIVTASASTAYTQSIFVKAAERTKGQLQMFGNSGGSTVNFDLVAGTATATGAYGGWASASATITNYGNGWYRITNTVTTNVGLTAVNWGVYLNDVLYTGDGVSGFYIWGAELEAGAFVTSYIPTVASTVTRAADVAVMTGTNFSSWYNQSAGTIVVQATAYGNKASSILTRIQDAAATTNFITARQSATGTQILGQTSSSGGLTAGLAATNFTVGVPFKIAVASAPSDVAASVNGGTVGTSTAMTTMPVVDRLNISEGGPFYVRQITYYPTRLTNAQLQALTT